jgi:hypothetical protein
VIARLPPRAVLDTSALVPPRLRIALQQAADNGQFIAIWPPWIVAELYRVLTWRWLERTRNYSAANYAACGRSAKTMMALLIATFETVSPVPPYPPAWPTLADLDDYPIWAAARLGRADYVVSNNSRDFPPPGPDGRHRYEGIEYLTAQEFLGRLVRGSH